MIHETEIVTEAAGVAVAECWECEDFITVLFIDGHKVKEYRGETALMDAQRDADEEIIKRIHGGGE